MQRKKGASLPGFSVRNALDMTIEEFVETRTRRQLLQEVFWECTLRCNLNCRHCGSDCRKDDMPQDMPFADFARVLDEIAREKDPSEIMIITTGGEPLVRKDIVECGREISRRGFVWGMVSNGMLLDAAKLRQLTDAGLKTIAISLDGFEAEHNWMRGNDRSFQRAIGAIEALRESEITWDVITCVNARNFSSLPRFRDFLVQTGVRYWRIFTVFPMGRAAYDAELQLTPEEFCRLMEFIEAERARGDIRVSYSCEGYLGGYEMVVRNHPFFCGAGINTASIRYDGAISGCLSIRSRFDQGNIYTDSFMEVWNNRFRQFRDRNWMRRDECAACKVWNVCRGGAMHLREENGTMMGCSYNKLLAAGMAGDYEE